MQVSDQGTVEGIQVGFFYCRRTPETWVNFAAYNNLGAASLLEDVDDR